METDDERPRSVLDHATADGVLTNRSERPMPDTEYEAITTTKETT